MVVPSKQVLAQDIGVGVDLGEKTETLEAATAQSVTWLHFGRLCWHYFSLVICMQSIISCPFTAGRVNLKS